MTASISRETRTNLLLVALLLVVAAYFLITKQMRPAPLAAPMPAMSMPGTMQMAPLPEDLDLSRSRLTDAGAFSVSIAPQNPDFQRNMIHAWIVTLKTPDGAPVAGAEITVDGAMPQHGHGLPTAPQVSRYLGDGRYLIEGLRFHMPGWWVLMLDIAAGDKRDAITFNLML